MTSACNKQHDGFVWRVVEGRKPSETRGGTSFITSDVIRGHLGQGVTSLGLVRVTAHILMDTFFQHFQLQKFVFEKFKGSPLKHQSICFDSKQMSDRSGQVGVCPMT